MRGQGYYTGTVYEMYTEGFSGAIGGGGRYDKMVEKFSGIACPVVGMSLGFEPICMLLKDKELDVRKNLALIYDKDDDILEVFRYKDVCILYFTLQYSASLSTIPYHRRPKSAYMGKRY